MITTAQAIEAIKTLSKYCISKTNDECENCSCPLSNWCYASEEGGKNDVPCDWKIPQERTEE